MAGGFAIHEWPVPARLTADEDVCSQEKIGGIYNPFNVDINTTPPDGIGTPDQYPVGDLSGKYGSFASRSRRNGDRNGSIRARNRSRPRLGLDSNLSLFGRYSVLGRSFVVYKTDGTRWFCVSLRHGYVEGLVRAIATFKSPVIGRIVMTQEENDTFSNTQVFVELNYANGVLLPTSGHRWGIHVNDVCSDFNRKSCSCAVAGSRYNPYGVMVNVDYQRECRRDNHLRCAMGDQSGKLGELSIRSNDGGFARAFYTDEHLQLIGEFSVIGKSIVIYDRNNRANRLACANIYNYPRRDIIVDQWYGSSPVTVRGWMKFSGNDPLFNEDEALPRINLYGLNGNAGPFHVHEYPVPTESISPCSPAAVGGHFNPFDVDIAQSPAPDRGTDDQYEVGDLSGKYGRRLDGRVRRNEISLTA